VLAGALVVGCSGGDTPALLDETPVPTATPTATPLPSPSPEPTTEPTPRPTPTPTPSRRGITDGTIGIGVLTTGQAFADLELGVQARLERAATDLELSRIVEVAAVGDDEGDADRALELVQRMVEDDEVFAVVLGSSVPVPAVTDYLERMRVPFVGWGFASGFCDPNRWGFGFSGCLRALPIGVPGAEVDNGARRVLEAAFGADITAVLVTTDDRAGDGARAEATVVWGSRLLGVEIVPPPAGGEIDTAELAEAVVSHGADVVLLSVGLGRSLEIGPLLRDVTEAAIVHDVAYLPGLLSDPEAAAALEGGYALSQFPPQEDGSPAVQRLGADLLAAGGPPVASQAVSLGYWSADVLVRLLAAVGDDLDTDTFAAAVDAGVVIGSADDGGPCPVDTTSMGHRPAGGAALLAIRNARYRSVVAFSCPPTVGAEPVDSP
jgi:ABC-type branched-subunit amino acid transport system substrate-binding protein